MNSVTISTDYKFIIYGCLDNTIRVWERESGTQIQFLKGHKNSVNSVAISSDNIFIVSGSGYQSFGSSDNTIRVWDRESGTQIQELIGHKDSVNSVAISLD